VATVKVKYALRLAEVASAEGIDVGRTLRAIIVAGEPGGSIPAIRERLESSWPGARVYDHHGMTEVGPVTYQCPARPGVLHVIEEAYLPEVIAVTTAGGTGILPVNSGAGSPCHGELVLTNLGRAGSPLLRYRTGDLVKPLPGPCACGSHELALEGGILGRVDDMVLVRGVNVYPSAVEAIVRSLPDIAEYRVEVHTAASLTELNILVETAPRCPRPQAVADALKAALRDALSLRVSVHVAPAGSLPRFEMKASRWTRK
jgi:phenylacetate-CoA ligase